MTSTIDVETFVHHMDAARDLVTRMISDYAQTLLDAQKRNVEQRVEVDQLRERLAQQGKTIEHLSAELRRMHAARYSSAEHAVGAMGATGSDNRPDDNVLRLHSPWPPSDTTKAAMQDARSDI